MTGQRSSSLLLFWKLYSIFFSRRVSALFFRSRTCRERETSLWTTYWSKFSMLHRS